MKKTLSLIVFMIMASVVYCLIHFNSKKYITNLAKKEMAKEINRLNSISRLYIHEGVYSFDCYETNYKTIVNQFGEKVVMSNDDYYASGQVSFRGDKIIISLNGKKEELVLGKPIITAYMLSNEYIIYKFPIVTWEVYYDQSNVSLFQFDSTENKIYRRLYKKSDLELPTLYLTIKVINNNGKQAVNPHIKIQSELGLRRTTSEPIENSKGKELRDYTKAIPRKFSDIADLGDFKIIPFRNGFGHSIYLSDMDYNYNSFGQVPKFVNEADYDVWVYQIETYLRMIKLIDYKNPLIIKSKWQNINL